MDRPIEICAAPRMPMPPSKQQMIKEFWRNIEEEIEDIDDFAERAIPVSRVRKVICAEKGAMMMTSDTPSFVTKACEVFVQELAFCAWMCAESHHRRIILDSDIAEAISSTESYDFLNDTLHAYEEVQNSIFPHTKPINKKRRLNQPSSSHLLPPYPMPKFSPQSGVYPPYVHAPVSMSPNNNHPSALAFPFLLQGGCSALVETAVIPALKLTGIIPPSSHMRRDPEFFGNNSNTNSNNNFTNNFVSCNSIFAPSAMNLPLQLYSRPVPEIPKACFNTNIMTNASTSSYGLADSSSDNAAIRKEDKHQQQKEKNTCDHLVDGNLEGIVVADTNDSGGISSDELDVESWLSEFWSDFMTEDPEPLIDPASTNVPQNLEEFDNEPYPLHEIVSNASDNNRTS